MAAAHPRLSLLKGVTSPAVRAQIHFPAIVISDFHVFFEVKIFDIFRAVSDLRTADFH